MARKTTGKRPKAKRRRTRPAAPQVPPQAPPASQEPRQEAIADRPVGQDPPAPDASQGRVDGPAGAEPAPKPLSPKHQRFVDEFLVDLNGTQATIRAGYSAKTATSQGSRLLRNVHIVRALQAAMAARAVVTGITQQRVLEELELIAFSRITHFQLNATGRLEVLEGAPPEAEAAVSKVRHKQKEIRGDHGDSTEFEQEIGLWDKVAALKLAGRHVGLFPDRIEHTGKGGGPIQVETLKRMTDAELKAYTRSLAEQAAKL